MNGERKRKQTEKTVHPHVQEEKEERREREDRRRAEKKREKKERGRRERENRRVPWRKESEKCVLLLLQSRILMYLPSVKKKDRKKRVNTTIINRRRGEVKRISFVCLERVT